MIGQILRVFLMGIIFRNMCGVISSTRSLLPEPGCILSMASSPFFQRNLEVEISWPKEILRDSVDHQPIWDGQSSGQREEIFQK